MTEVMYLIGRFMTNFMSHKVLRASRASFYFKAEEMVLGINGLAIFGGGAWYQRVGNCWRWKYKGFFDSSIHILIK